MTKVIFVTKKRADLTMKVITALLDRLLHHAHMLKCGPRSWRTKSTDLRTEEGTK